jgi:hypothetical protein
LYEYTVFEIIDPATRTRPLLELMLKALLNKGDKGTSAYEIFTPRTASVARTSRTGESITEFTEMLAEYSALVNSGTAGTSTTVTRTSMIDPTQGVEAFCETSRRVMLPVSSTLARRRSGKDFAPMENCVWFWPPYEYTLNINDGNRDSKAGFTIAAAEIMVVPTGAPENRVTLALMEDKTVPDA